MSEINQQNPVNLSRFLEAQEAVYETALTELRNGKKRSHWSWFVLPQIRGLGSSAMAVRYAISDLAEAKAYLEHPILGARLKETFTALLEHHHKGAAEILGDIDAMKLKSCLTLFDLAAEGDLLFKTALNKFYSGEHDAATIAIIAEQSKPG